MHFNDSCPTVTWYFRSAPTIGVISEQGALAYNQFLGQIWEAKCRNALMVTAMAQNLRRWGSQTAF